MTKQYNAAIKKKRRKAKTIRKTARVKAGAGKKTKG
jgi:hypothetical protein